MQQIGYIAYEHHLANTIEQYMLGGEVGYRVHVYHSVA